MNTQKIYFNSGQVLLTSHVANSLSQGEIKEMLDKHFSCDFGDLSKADINSNLKAIKNKDDRIMSAYNSKAGRIYVITEYDQSATTVLFSNEY